MAPLPVALCENAPMNRALFLLPWLALSACAPRDTTISLQGYNKSCATAADCVVVQAGDICGGCNCGNDGINRADLDKYNAELNEKQADCAEPPELCPCVALMPLCTQGKCTLQ